MKRSIEVHLGKTPQRIGTLHYNQDGRRETSAFVSACKSQVVQKAAQLAANADQPFLQRALAEDALEKYENRCFTSGFMEPDRLWPAEATPNGKARFPLAKGSFPKDLITNNYEHITELSLQGLMRHCAAGTISFGQTSAILGAGRIQVVCCAMRRK